MPTKTQSKTSWHQYSNLDQVWSLMLAFGVAILPTSRRIATPNISEWDQNWANTILVVDCGGNGRFFSKFLVMAKLCCHCCEMIKFLGIVFGPKPYCHTIRSSALKLLRDEGMGKHSIEVKINEDVYQTLHQTEYWQPSRHWQVRRATTLVEYETVRKPVFLKAYQWAIETQYWKLFQIIVLCVVGLSKEIILRTN